MTKGELRDRVFSTLRNFDPLVQVPQQTMDQFIEYAQREQYRSLVNENPALFTQTVVLSDGDSLPADWNGYAYRAYYVSAGKRIAFRWITPEKLGIRKKSPYNQATASQPDLHFGNQKLNTVPAAIGTVTVSYIKRPPALFGQADSTDDGLPDYASSLVWRRAAIRCIEFFLDPRRQFQYGEKMRQTNLASLKTFVALRYAKLKEDMSMLTPGGN